MALFNKKRLQPRFVRFLHRKLESPDTPPDQKATIEKALADQALIGKASTKVFALLRKRGALDRPEAVAALTAMDAVGEGERPFLDWLMAMFAEYWDEILALLLKLLGL